MHAALVHRDLHQRTRGGICTVYHALAKQLVSHGVTVTLITQQTPHPIRVTGVTGVTLPRTDKLVDHRQAVAEVLDHVRPDVVDCSTWEAEALSYTDRPRPKRAPVLVRGEFSAATLGAAELARDERRLVHQADKVIAVSEFAARDLASAYQIPVPPAVPNGVDRDRFHPGPIAAPSSGYRIALDRNGLPTARERLSDLFAAGTPVGPWRSDPDGRPQLVWVGKITPMKGWDRLEAIVRRLHGIASLTVLLGHSPAYSPVTLDSSQDVTLLHDLDDSDLPSFYRAADWLLSTSRWEGFGLAIAEALACGTPVLLPEQLGTAPELLSAGGGHTYRDPDHVATLLRCPPPRAALPGRFSWSSNADATLSLYRRLTAS